MSSVQAGKNSATPYVVAVAVTGFVLFLAYLLFFMPKLQEVKEVKAETKQVAQQITILEEAVRNVDEQQANLPKLAEEMAAFNKAFTLDPEQQALFASVMDLGSANGVNVVGMNPQVPAVSDGTTGSDDGSSGEVAEPAEAEEAGEAAEMLASVTFKIDATGPADGLRRFLAGLEKLERPVSVKSFEIHDGDESYTLGATAQTWMAAPLAVPQTAAQDADK